MKFATVILLVAIALSSQSQAASQFAAGCKRFHVVSANDTCALVAAEYGITTTQLYSWNGGLHTTCDNLDDGTLVCVSLTGTSTITDNGAPSSAAGASSAAASSAATSASAASSAVSFAPASVSSTAISQSFILPTSPISGASSSASASGLASAALASTTPSKAPSAGVRETVSAVAVFLVSVAVAGTLLL